MGWTRDSQWCRCFQPLKIRLFPYRIVFLFFPFSSCSPRSNRTKWEERKEEKGRKKTSAVPLMRTCNNSNEDSKPRFVPLPIITPDLFVHHSKKLRRVVILMAV